MAMTLRMPEQQMIVLVAALVYGAITAPDYKLMPVLEAGAPLFLIGQAIILAVWVFRKVFRR